ncbi:MAG: hypothetical protein ACI9ON_000143 [Limisphaerales bacterium]|jgi:hypothetical protein
MENTRIALKRLCWWVAILFCSPVVGHELNYSTSELEWRLDPSRLAVTHTIHLDDAAVLLASLGDYDGTLDAQTQAKLMRYVEDHFELTLEERAVPLTPLGAQVDGDRLLIFQEIVLSRAPHNMSVRNTLMQQLFSRHSNQVSFLFGEKLQTLFLDASHTEDTFAN